MANKAIIFLAGHIGTVDELKQTGSGKSVLRFSLAVATGYKDNRKTSWYRCSVWGARAETLAGMLRKGMNILVDGQPEIQEYTTDNGVKRVSVEVMTNGVEFLEKKQEAPSQDREPEYDEDGNEVPF